MAVYLVTWDLNNEKPNYAQARERFLSGFNYFGADVVWDTKLDSVRFVSTPMTANQLYDHIRSFMDATDRIVITRVYRDVSITQGLLSPGMWEWISARY